MSPERSEPNVRGRGCGIALFPALIQSSQGPTPAAATFTRTSPGPGSGRATCSSCMASGGPNSWTRHAIIGEFIGSSLVRSRERLIRRIDDEYGEQPRRLGLTGIGAHSMMGAGVFKPRLAGAIDAGRLVIDLAADLAREHVGVDEGGARVAVRRRGLARRVFDDQADQALAGRVC